MAVFDSLMRRWGATGKNMAGRVDPERATMHTTPWSYRSEDGVYVGHNGTVWVYYVLPVGPITWEDPPVQLRFASQLHGLLSELGATSTVPPGGLRSLSVNREVHLAAIAWDAKLDIPADTPDGLRDYIERAFSRNQTGATILVPRKTLFLGVKLRNSLPSSEGQQGGKALVEQFQKMMTQGLGEGVPNLAPYDGDLEKLDNIVSRFGARQPTRDERNQLQFWYNFGRHGDTLNVERRTWVDVGGHSDIRFSAVRDFEAPVQHAPDFRWLEAAMYYPDGPEVVSIRAELERPEVTRTRSRRAQRQMKAQIEEEAATGDLGHEEYSETLNLASQYEEFVRNLSEPLLTNASILFAHRMTEQTTTYADYLSNRFGIAIKPLEHRQLEALEETLPTSQNLLNPFLKEMSVSMVSQSGIQAHASLGDKRGFLMGLTDPAMTPCFLDPLAAPRENRPPTAVVIGEPGAGKTFLLQMLAVQAARADLPVVFINPKGYPRETSSLEGTAELVGGRVVRLSDLRQEPGMLDPFGYADPGDAAQIAYRHIVSVLRFGDDESKQLTLQNGLRKGADAGARCVGEALKHVEDEEILALVDQQRFDPMFNLAISDSPANEMAATGSLTLIEFDQALETPSPRKNPADYTKEERLAIATMRLVTRAALHMLVKGGAGGMLIVDEAWQLLNQPETEEDLERMSRLGRSQNLLPILATQKISDVLERGLEQYITRVFLMQMRDRTEAAAGLTVCGLEPTAARIDELRQMGPRSGSGGAPDKWAEMIHRDLQDRHAAVWVGPVPATEAAVFTTNPEERHKARLQKEQLDEPARDAEPDPREDDSLSDGHADGAT